MTRETKIGLLVGLAFCIMIGILLSNYFATTTEPIAASLSNTASNVRDSVGSPVSDPPPITIVTQSVSPREPMTSRPDPSLSRPTQSIVQVGGPASAIDSTPIQIRESSSHPTAPQPTRESSETASSPSSPPAAPSSLVDVAQSNGEPIVGMGEPGNSTPASESGGRKYVAAAGDTLSRLAGRFMGGNTKAHRDAIVKANPSLERDPDRIIVGHTYVIPSADATAIAAPSTVAAAPPAPTTPPAPVAPSETVSQPQFWYTVKANDSLWSIAAEQLGNGSAWTAIKDLNADVLKGSDTVQPSMKLRLPAKPLASAQ